MRLAAVVALLLAQLKGPARPAPMAHLVVIGTSEKPYVVATSCGPDKPAITFTLLAQNVGSAASMAINDPHAVFVQDNANPGWAAGATLPALPPGGNAKVTVTLPGLKAAGSMSGHHVFTATANALHAMPEQSYANNSVTIAIDLPQGFCSPPGSTLPQAPSQQITAPLPPPTDLTNTITQAVCANYGGPAAALACSIGLPAGKLVLVWSYPSNVQIDGFHVYMTSGGTVRNIGSPQPVATQKTPGVRLAVLDPPPVGTCYAVTAFRGEAESPHSPTTFCVRQNDAAKSISLKPDRTGCMYISVYVDPSNRSTTTWPPTIARSTMRRRRTT